jgi:O-methyltransferase
MSQQTTLTEEQREEEKRAILMEAAAQWFMAPPEFATMHQRMVMVGSSDPVRYGALHHAFSQIKKENIQGCFAEGGVYKGHLSKFIRGYFPDRKMYLFDTFQGFDDRDTDNGNDSRFRDTSIEGVKEHIGNLDNIIFCKGFFPETTQGLGLENERFAFVMLDFDKYEPTLAGLELFYPLLVPGGFLFLHDYNNPESNWACSRAMDKFMADKPEKTILLPDSWGSAMFRKI